jgi:uncharacterized protein YciI
MQRSSAVRGGGTAPLRHSADHRRPDDIGTSVPGPVWDHPVMAMFAVTTAKGSAWDATRRIRDQADFEAHAHFMDELVNRGVIVLGGPIDSEDTDDVALLAVSAESPAHVQAIFGADPWTASHVFRLKSVCEWSIWLDARSG